MYIFVASVMRESFAFGNVFYCDAGRLDVHYYNGRTSTHYVYPTIQWEQMWG